MTNLREDKEDLSSSTYSRKTNEKSNTNSLSSGSLPTHKEGLDPMTILALQESLARIEKEGVRAFSKQEIKDLFDSL